MKIERVVVTIEIAVEWLKTSKKNRPLRVGFISQLVREMRAGLFHETPEPIMFDEDGALCDGHHRLNAIVKAGVTLPLWVARGVPRSSVPHINRGIPRSLGDRMFAYTDHRVIKKITRGQPGRAIQLAAINVTLYNMLVHQKNPSMEECVRITSRFEDPIAVVIDRVGACTLCRRAAVMTAFILALDWAASQSERQRTRMVQFMDAVKSGEMLQVGEPTYTLRDYLLSVGQRTRRHAKAARIDSQWIIFIKTLRACQAHLTGEKMRKLQVLDHPGQLLEWSLGCSRATLAKKLKLLGEAPVDESLSNDEDEADDEAAE